MTDLAWLIFSDLSTSSRLMCSSSHGQRVSFFRNTRFMFFEINFIIAKMLKTFAIMRALADSFFLKSIIALKKIMVNFETFGRLNKHKNLISEECVSQFFCLFYCLKNYFVKLIPNPFYRLFLFFPGLLL